MSLNPSPVAAVAQLPISTKALSALVVQAAQAEHQSRAAEIDAEADEKARAAEVRAREIEEKCRSEAEVKARARAAEIEEKCRKEREARIEAAALAATERLAALRVEEENAREAAEAEFEARRAAEDADAVELAHLWWRDARRERTICAAPNCAQELRAAGIARRRRRTPDEKTTMAMYTT